MENYKGSVSLIAGLTQQDNGDFYLLNTDQIQADSDGTSLTDKLKNLSIGTPGEYTVYDDTAIKNRVSALESKTDKDTTYTAGTGINISKTNEISTTITEYDDTALSTRVAALESKTDKDTTYTAGTAISISKANEISVNRSALNIPEAYDDTTVKNLISTNTASIGTANTNISNLDTRVTTLETDIAETIAWIMNEYEPTSTTDE